jgi:hypothetical protein
MSSNDHLFMGGDLRASIDSMRTKLVERIGNLSSSQLPSPDHAQISAHFVGEFTINPIELRRDAMELIEPREVEVEKIDCDFGQRYRRKVLEFRFEIPFDGDAVLLRLRPSQITFNPPRGAVAGDRVVFTFHRADRDKEAIQREVNEFFDSLGQHIGWQRAQIDSWNQGLPALVEQLVNARREKLIADNKLVEDLGFRVRRRDDPPSSYTIPVQRKTVVPSLPAARAGPFAKPEPALDMVVYEEILDTLAGMSVVLERNPSAFAAIDEESLRTHFLVPLNSKFQGLATGETFNAAGKTDILIKHEDRILFVAECKFWKGPQSLTDAISQLLSYMTWRETKAAILLFNRNRDFSAVLQQIPGVFAQHPQHVRRENYSRSTGFRFVLRHPQDPQRFLTVTLLAFDVPASN